MTMELREIRKNDAIFEYLDDIWNAEAKMPRWFRDASYAWQDNLADFTAFVSECAEVYGLFDGDTLFACIYFEKEREPGILTIHLSVVRRLEPEIFIAHCIKLRDMVLHRGIRRVRGWVVVRNRGLLKLLESVGFLPTGFYMDHGMSHGKLLRWQMIEVRR